MTRQSCAWLIAAACGALLAAYCGSPGRDRAVRAKERSPAPRVSPVPHTPDQGAS